MPYSQDGHDVPKYIRGEKKRRQFSHVWNSEYQRQKAKGKSDAEAERIAFASANSVTSKAAENNFTKLLQKSIDDDAKEFVNAVLTALEKEWASLPGQVRDSLANAGLSGVGQGLLQIDVSNSALISSANAAAQAYAVDRAAELVGMKYDEEGNLIPNPDARWAISDTTRNRIREIIAESFTEDTPIVEIKDAIQEALEEEATGNGIFSEARAAMIARTEVQRAQIGGNFSTWEKSGVVKKVKWLTSNLKPCDECEGNEEIEVEIGKPFPSGAIMPPDHPNCACVLIVSEVSTA